MAREQIHSLTGIRGFASIWVVFHHAPNLHALHDFEFGALGEFFEKGWLGVDLFFVLSGFVISHVYLDRMTEFSWASTWRFLKLRLARVYPAHLVATLALVPLVLIGRQAAVDGFPAHNFTLAQLAYALSLTNGWGFPDSAGWNQPSWSVSSEWFVYLSFPVLALLLGRRRSLTASVVGAVAIVAAMSALGLWLTGGVQSTLVWSWSVVRVVGEFGVGCLLYDVYRRTGPGRGWDVAASVAVVAVVGLSLAGLPHALDFILIALFAVLVLALSRSRGRMADVFAGRALVYLGDISYSVYLIHSVVLIVMSQATRMAGYDPATTTWPLVFAILAVFLAASIACGHLLFRYVEGPSRRWLRTHWVGR